MYFPLTQFAILLVIFSTTLYALDATTTKAPILHCKNQKQCPSTYFCNLKQSVCLHKYVVNNACQNSIECLNGVCINGICRQSCNTDNDCPRTTEFCSSVKYCVPKHCRGCTRNAQCANNYCLRARCEISTCTSALNALRKKL
jgi:hypothetical protein